jgi:hypothetical protein
VSDGMASSGRDAGVVTCAPFVLGEEPGAIVAGFDVHRRQITIDALDTATGEVSREQIEFTPATVEHWVVGFLGRTIYAGSRKLKKATPISARPGVYGSRDRACSPESPIQHPGRTVVRVRPLKILDLRQLAANPSSGQGKRAPTAATAGGGRDVP